MTLESILSDLTIFGVFLLIGFVLRELIKPFQRLFLPASLIGGLLLLILGPQVLGLVSVPDSFGDFAGVVIGVIMTGLILGITVNVSRVRSFADYTFISLGLYGLQAGVGLALGMVLMGMWPGLPEGWGVMSVFSFWGGHGTSGAAGAAFSEQGVPENLGIGMILATIGLISGVLIGLLIINIGVRKGWARYLGDVSTRPSWFFGGTLPKDQQAAIGHEKVSSLSVSNLALQISFIFVALVIGQSIIQGIGHLVPFFNELPALIYGMVGAIIVVPLMTATKTDRYLDRKTIGTVNGFLLEIIILTAVATIPLDLATQYLVPVLIMSVVMVVMTTIVTLGMCRLFCKDDWFEKAVMMFGAGLGHTGVGLMLLRTVDPETKSDAAEAIGVASGITSWLKVFPVLFPMLIIQGASWIVIVVSLGMAVACFVLCFVFLGRGRNRSGGAGPQIGAAARGLAGAKPS
ncbi:hypothetical protein AB0K08_15460 [Citricoccus sp. NPDC055426]|uniref:hypothetical protein n=1 Tax=Citricoccus sp. NPDC055426 TaxID=3155536 RepID=UPI00342DE53E